MKKKIISFCILGIFLIAGVSATSAMKNDTTLDSDVTMQKDLPDLIIEKITTNTIYKQQYNWWELHISARIKNQGTATAKDYFEGDESKKAWSAFYIEGEHEDSARYIGDLDPGESQTIKVVITEWSMTRGKYEIKVWADWINRIPESNENNNNLTIIYKQSRTRSINHMFFNNIFCNKIFSFLEKHLQVLEY